MTIYVPLKVFRVAAMACPPLFYIMAAEKEKIKPLFKALFSRSGFKQCNPTSCAAHVKSTEFSKTKRVLRKLLSGEFKQALAQRDKRDVRVKLHP